MKYDNQINSEHHWPSVIPNYPFHENKSRITEDTFDLDRIERERRQSHASLFNLNLSYNEAEEFGRNTAV